MSDEIDWSGATWEGNRNEMIRRSLRLTVRERLEQLGELRDLAENLGEARLAPSSSSPLDLVLGGCRPTPLASYLKALGVLRLVSEQEGGDPGVRGRWGDAGFYLVTFLDREALLDFFLTKYRPTPMLAPWNGGSGFFPNDNKDGIGPVETSKASRFAPLRRTIGEIRWILTDLELTGGMRPESKTELLTRLRAELNDEALAWFDAAILLTEEAPRYPPLLGTGGNDGRLDFTNNFLQRLVDLFDMDSGDPKPESTQLLRGALFGEAVPGLWGSAMGQYAPSDTGGPNASAGFSGGTLMNPWDFLLMLEGALLFAASASRRLESGGGGRLAYPFTVRPIGVGNGSTALSDEKSSRGEVWMPLWPAAVSLSEVQGLLGEGRAVVNGRPVRDGLDFVRAIAKLGVDRGISEFVRYGFLMRNGKAYLASPLTRVKVRSNPDGDLIDELDVQQWLTRFISASGPGGRAPARLISLGRRLQDGLFWIARAEGSRRAVPGRIQAVLITLGEIQRYYASAPQARETIAPIPLLSRRWVEAADDGSAAFRIAVALAGVHAVKGPSGEGASEAAAADPERHWVVGMRMAAHFAPVADDFPRPFRTGNWTVDSRDVVWREGALDRALVAVLERRLLRVEQEGVWEKPLARRYGAPLRAISDWLLAGSRFDDRIAALLQGLVLARIPASLPRKPNRAGRSSVALPTSYALLKPLFVPERELARIGAFRGSEGKVPPALPLRLDLVRAIVGDSGEERRGDRSGRGPLSIALRRLQLANLDPTLGGTRGLGAREGDLDADGDRLSPALAGVGTLGVDGRRLLAALMVPISRVSLKELLERLVAPPREPTPSSFPRLDTRDREDPSFNPDGE